MDMKLCKTREIIEAAREKKLLRNELAYVLATSYWETGHTMEPVREAYYISHDEHVAEAWRRRHLRYYPYYGRGFVQLTWVKNYKWAETTFKIPAVANPDCVMEPATAVQILIVGMVEGVFTGKKLSDYITLQKSDFLGARRIINGTDKAEAIAHIAVQYDDELKTMGYGSVNTPIIVLPLAPPPAMPAELPVETEVIVIPHPAAANPIPPSKKGFAVLGAMLVTLVMGAARYFGVV